MNNSTDSGNSPSGFPYAFGVTTAILTLIILLTLVAYFCTSRSHQAAAAVRRASVSNIFTRDASTSSSVHEVGIDEATLRGYPKFLYTQAKDDEGRHDDDQRGESLTSSSSSSCSICLGEYKEGEWLRLLPDCGHIFHLKCVDPWLRLHPTCPICRNSPLPTPLSTPLAEVAPFASQR